MQGNIDAYHPHRHWNAVPATVPSLDVEDANSDKEDSLSERYAFLLGQDIGRCRLKMMDECASDTMARGYREGLTRRAHHADGYLRKLLGLRANAFGRGLPVSSAISVDFIKSIDVPVCPVSGVALTKATRQPTDWSIERLDNGLGYVPGNVCVVARRVNTLKGTLTLEELLGHAALMVQRHGGAVDAGGSEELSAVEALRLASLASGPCGFAAGKVGKLPPLASAPGVWGTPAGNVAIVHVECARSRVEGRCHHLRARWFKSLDGSAWMDSNRLVRRLQEQLASGRHPCDVWFEPDIAGGLENLMQSLSLRAHRDENDTAQQQQQQHTMSRLVAALRPIQAYRRIRD